MNDRPDHDPDQPRTDGGVDGDDTALAGALLDEVPSAGADFWARVDASLEQIADGGETAAPVVRLTHMNERSSRPSPASRIAAVAAAVMLIGALAVFAFNVGGGSTSDIGPADESGTSVPEVSTETSVDPDIVGTSVVPEREAPVLSAPEPDPEVTAPENPALTTTTTEVAVGADPVFTSTLIDVFGTGGPFAVDEFDEPTTGPNGSGCAPGPGPLPDGVWFGSLRSADAGPPFTVNFDLMCEYTGENAPVDDFEFDDYVQNDSDAERAVPVADHAALYLGYCYDDSRLGTGEINPPLVAVDVLPELGDENGTFSRVVEVSVWLLVTDGEIVEILDGWYSCAG